ncbi:hypothetical protein [Campylobacter majalis]|uniref:hypothetical protein n=1 Tax=Campylobacter majalis TaxID=2790656 RepID=UPI003D681261
MWEGLLNSFKTGLNNSLSNLDWGKAIGGAGALWSAYNQSKNAKDALKLQKDAYNFNKMLSQREINRQDKAQNSLYDAWNNSSYARM